MNDHTPSTYDVTTLAQLRLRAAEHRHQLRVTEDGLTILRAREEQRIIDEAGGESALGPNEAARKRQLTIRLAESPDYPPMLEAVRALQHVTEHLEAQIEIQRDLRRHEEGAALRARLLAEDMGGRA